MGAFQVTIAPKKGKDGNEGPKKFSTNIRVLLCFLGIVFFFVWYSLLQERIITTPYVSPSINGGEPVYFTYTTFLVLMNRVIAGLISLSWMIYCKQSLRNTAPLHTYFLVSLSNSVAASCQYEALKHLSFPTQTIGKSVKVLPVMVVGTLINGKRYSLREYGMAFCISMGCALFLLTGDISSNTSSHRADVIFGLILMVIYMISDASTSTFQEQMYKRYNMTMNDQIVYVNIFSSLLCVGVLVVNAQLVPAITMMIAYPQLFLDSVLLALTATFGQLVIYYMVKEFGALVFAVAMVTRHVLAIIISCIFFSHPLSNLQILGSVLVFGTVYYKSLRCTKILTEKENTNPK